MSTLTTPSYAIAGALISEAQRAALLARAADDSPALTAIFRQPGLELVYLNATGRRWLDAENRSRGELTLHDLIGVGTAGMLQNPMLVQTSVLGKWSGDCTLRDVWGSEFPVKVTLVAGTGTPDFPEGHLCLQAVRLGHGTTSDAPVTTSDHELLNALLETIPEAVYFKDRHSRFMRVSRALAEKDGCNSPSDLIGLTDFDRFTSEHSQAAYADEQRIIRTGESIINLEEKETWPDGRITWVSSTKMPLRDPEGRIVGTFGISRDITARKLEEQQRHELEMQLQLAQKLESIGRLAAGIAHEINTPSQFIADNTHFLKTSFQQLGTVVIAYRGSLAALPAEIAATVRAAEAEAELDYLLAEIPRTLEQTLEGLGRIARIVRSLKEFSHPNNARRSSADLNHAIENAITVTRHEWKYVADVVTEFDPGLPPVNCVIDEFNQVMLNLLVNAGHAIGAALKADPARPRGRIVIRTRHDEENIFIEVADDGTGIPAEIRHRIFEPFFTTKEIGQGTGQGLTLVHTVVKHHGGSIDFTSEPGRGTTFRIRLPRANS